MKSEINLLQYRIQKRRAHRALIFGVGKFLRHVYVFLILLAAALSLIFVAMLSIQRIVLDDNSTGRDLVDINTKARDTNQLLREFEGRVAGYRNWSRWLEKIIQAVSEGMNITSILAKEGEEVVTIEGVANNRQAVQEFQARLESMEGVDSLEAPLQNFATGEVAKFTFVVTLKPLEKE